MKLSCNTHIRAQISRGRLAFMPKCPDITEVWSIQLEFHTSEAIHSLSRLPPLESELTKVATLVISPLTNTVKMLVWPTFCVFLGFWVSTHFQIFWRVGAFNWTLLKLKVMALSQPFSEYNLDGQVPRFGQVLSLWVMFLKGLGLVANP